jgi:U4/U6 small nuclear ribonucleoprotein PRP3
MQPKFASIQANVRNAPTPPPTAAIIPTEVKTNPYSSAAASSSAKESGFDGAPKEKIGRGFRFNQKGKYVAMGNQMRQDVWRSHVIYLESHSLSFRQNWKI